MWFGGFFTSQSRALQNQSVPKNLSQQIGKLPSKSNLWEKKKIALWVHLSPSFLFSLFITTVHHLPHIYFPCTDTREACSDISGHGKNFRQQLHIYGTYRGYHHFPHHCSSPSHGSSCGWYIAFYLNSAEVGRWHTNGFALQLPPYLEGYPRLHWRFKAWGVKDLSTADSWVPSQTANWSGSDYWTGWTGQFCCDPEALVLRNQSSIWLCWYPGLVVKKKR